MTVFVTQHVDLIGRTDYPKLDLEQFLPHCHECICNVLLQRRNIPQKYSRFIFSVQIAGIVNVENGDIRARKMGRFKHWHGSPSSIPVRVDVIDEACWPVTHGSATTSTGLQKKFCLICSWLHSLGYRGLIKTRGDSLFRACRGTLRSSTGYCPDEFEGGGMTILDIACHIG